MPDFITEKDPVVVHVEIPNFHGNSFEYLEAQKKVEATYKEYLKFIDECEVTGNFDPVKVGEKFNRCLEAECIKDDLYDKMVSNKEVHS